MRLKTRNDISDIYGTLHLTAEYTCFSSTSGIFSRTHHMLDQRWELFIICSSKIFKGKDYVLFTYVSSVTGIEEVLYKFFAN